MEVDIGDKVFYTRLTGLCIPAKVFGRSDEGYVELEYHQDVVRVVNHRCPMDAISLGIPSWDSPPPSPLQTSSPAPSRSHAPSRSASPVHPGLLSGDEDEEMEAPPKVPTDPFVDGTVCSFVAFGFNSEHLACWSQRVASIGAHFVALYLILHPEVGMLPSVWTVGTCSPSCLEEHRSNR